jgi:hypothetical protein
MVTELTDIPLKLSWRKYVRSLYSRLSDMTLYPETFGLSINLLNKVAYLYVYWNYSFCPLQTIVIVWAYINQIKIMT